MYIEPPPGGAHFGAQRPTLINVLTPMSLILLAQARGLVTGGQYQFAVILAQAACELATEEALTNLMARRGAAFLSDVTLSMVGRGVALNDSKVRRLYGTLADDYPAGHSDLKRDPAPWWVAWEAGRKLRHAVAHKGSPIDAVQSTACVESAEQYVQHLAATVSKVAAS